LKSEHKPRLKIYILTKGRVVVFQMVFSGENILFFVYFIEQRSVVPNQGMVQAYYG
jgi:hypothetical protein